LKILSVYILIWIWLISLLNGEIIQWISPEIGLLHRGTEKLMECNYYNLNIIRFIKECQLLIHIITI